MVFTELDTMDSAPATTDLLVSLALFTAPRVIVEAGTYKGHTSVALAYVTMQAGIDCTVWTTDTVNYLDPKLPAILGELGVVDRIKFGRGDFAAMLENVKDSIDLAYIDASSSNSELRWEHFNAVWPRMRVGGLVCVDDCAGDWPHANDFCRMASLYLPANRGLAILKKGE